MRTLPALCLALSLAACGSFAPNTNARAPITLSGSRTFDASEVTVVDQAPATAIRISGIDCRNKLWDPVPTPSGAINALKNEVQKLGKTQVAVISVEAHRSPLSINCWSALVATGAPF